MLLEEEYYIGVPHLDAQHRALFKTMDRVKDILMKDDYERNKRLCKEAIKFWGPRFPPFLRRRGVYALHSLCQL